MANVKWIKIVIDIFNDEKMLFIEQLPDADSIIVIWFKLLTLAGKINNGGVLLFNERMPYTDEMLATIFRRPINTVRLALKTFEEFEMVEIVNHTITIPNWSKHQTLDQLQERNEYMKSYMRKYRENQKQLASGECKVNSKVNSKPNCKANVNSLDIELEEDIELDIEEERDSTIPTLSKKDIDNLISKWNELNLQQLRGINKSTNRYTMLRTRIKEYGLDDVLKAISNIGTSSFLQGQNNKGWIITFDWFVKPNNFIKVLEGNYMDKDKGATYAGADKQSSKKDTGIDIAKQAGVLSF